MNGTFDHDDGHYNHVHRALIQAFLSRSVMTEAELKPVVAAILTAYDPSRPHLPADMTGPMLTPLLQSANARLNPLDLEIRSVRDQTTRSTTHYALVNTSSDSLTQLATSYSHDEIAYIKRLLDAMFDTNNTRAKQIMAVTGMRATQLAAAPRAAPSRQSQGGAAAATTTTVDSDTEQDASQQQPQPQPQQVQVQTKSVPNPDRVLTSLLSDGFLQRSRAGYYALAPRALMELRAYLKETYNGAPVPPRRPGARHGGGGGGINAEEDDDDDEEEDEEDDEERTIRVFDCEGCRDIVTYGLRCDELDCGVRWHDGCAAQFFGGQSGGGGAAASQRGAGAGKICPGPGGKGCGRVWTGSTYVGERADGVGIAGGAGSRGR